MGGGFGNDVYFVDSAKDVIDEALSGGNDTIKATTSIDLGAYSNIENVVLMGSGALTVKGTLLGDNLGGNDGANLLSGFGGDDTLNGGKGNDILIAGSGESLLIGGLGNDRLDVSLGNDAVEYTNKLDGQDVVLGFDGDPTGGQDVLDLDKLFDSLGVSPDDRAERVEIYPYATTVFVVIDADGNPHTGNEGYELGVAILHTTDAITVGEDVLTGS